MVQHFLLSAAARSLSMAQIMRMSESWVETVFLRLRWPQTDGKPVCSGCGRKICYSCRRPSGHPRWRCKACRSDFSITSGTLFAWHKLPLRTYLLAIAIFCDEVKGKSMRTSMRHASQAKPAAIWAAGVAILVGALFLGDGVGFGQLVTNNNTVKSGSLG
jgi:hypothetical protein